VAVEPVWPTVLGYLCLVYGVLISLGAILGLATPFALELFASMMPPDAQAQRAFDQTTTTVVLNTAYYLPALVMNIVLCVLGYRLAKRRHSAPRHLTLWAWLKVLLEFVGAGVTYYATMYSMRSQMEITTASGQAGGNAVVVSNPFVVGMAVATAIWSLLLGLALPIFLIIWFWRSSVTEYVRTWSTPGSPPAR
jgi:hypothetical protein